MTADNTRRFGMRPVLATASAAMILLASPALAFAQDPSAPESDAATTDTAAPGIQTFGTERLGFGETIDFRGSSDVVTLTVPVPDGLRPEALDTTIELPANVARGSIDIESGGRLLGRVDIRPEDATAPVSLPLGAATVENREAVVSLRMNLFAVDNICPEDWDTRSITLRDGAVRYVGTPTEPTVLADFLPPVLERLDVYLPAEPSAVESDTAIGLASSITARYTGRAPAVEVRPTPPNGIPPAAENPFVRQIVVSETGPPDGTAELGDIPGGPPALYLRGDRDGLATQTRIITSLLSDLAVSSDVSVGAITAPPQLSRDITTLDDLGIGGQTTTSVGVAQVRLYLDQARFGRPVGNLGLDLKGSYTPLPDTEGGLLTVEAGETVLASWAAESSGIIDRAIAVPATAMQRSTELTVSLRTTGGQRQCGIEHPVALSVDGDTHVTSTIADPPAPDGFASLPQTLMPQVDVAATGTGIVDTARAVDIIAGLQSLTPARLDPEWVSLDEALGSSKPAVIVAAEGNLPEDLPLRLTRTEDRRFELAGAEGASTSLTFGTDVSYASMQVLRDNDRTVLVATSTDVPAELDRTLRWLAADPERWPGLSGHVLFTTEGRDPVTLSDPRGDVLAASEEGISAPVRWALVGAAALVVIGVAGGAVLMVLRRNRRKPR
ncbi:hypothetical protein [Rhodococcus sp. SJ-2]